jgi:thioesterase domain-containing protein
LPEYMAPTALVVLDALPLTPNGKVDRRALPAPDAARPDLEESFVPPKSLLQLQLVRIWEEILDVRPVGITDDFFALGGHSLLAARLAARIMDDLGKRIPLATLFSGATIEHLEEVLLRSEDQGPESPVVQVQGGNGKRPFFFLHGDLRDSGLYSLKLARALDPDRPFYVIHPALTKGRALPHTLEAIAAEHLEALRAIQPEGPYLLGGFCAGAYVAFEMAQQLQAQGEQADMLVMIEPDPTNARARLAWLLLTRWGDRIGLEPEKRVRLFLLLRNDVKNRLLQFLQTKKAETIAGVNTFVSIHLARLVSLLRPGPRSVRLPAPFPTNEIPVFLTEEAADRLGRHSWAIAGYMPRQYRGRVALFWSRDKHRKPMSDPTNGWKAVAEDIDVHFTPGGHNSMITTYVETLAEQLRLWLNTGEGARTDESTTDDR